MINIQFRQKINAKFPTYYFQDSVQVFDGFTVKMDNE